MEPLEHREASAGLMELLEELAVYGADPEGGVTRLLYSQPWGEAQRYLAGKMRQAGLSARFDRAGNLFGRLEGAEREAGVILTGSHVDTVVRGGKYDGAYGIAAGIAALAYLSRTFGVPKRSLEVVSFCEEEGSRFPVTYWGSGHAAGKLDWALADAVSDPDGVTLRQAMEAAGFGASEQPDCRRTNLAAYVELHIEQGIVLERSGEPIGIVETIVGQRRYAISLSGESNHAGTTPMGLRKDALAGAAAMIAALEAMALEYGDPLVATVGRLDAEPNTPNVVAGRVRFTLDIRLDREDELARFCEEALARLASIAAKRGLAFEAANWLATAPAPMDARLVALLERASVAAGLKPRRMVSGAGHDAQLMAGICPSAMLFVPSRGGISHSPDEYTAPAQLEDGVRVLAAALYELAYR
ncbi:M20 family metallo-hydrolase [Paenibacillus aurantiacus]|uniref:M20 family metallo-hydrolase n=1 Tax=Paenibacillus aurantiacus TaxID=1936118 RepID=A0ABV5L3R5_9BACL